jgi:hypothetical protein
MPHEILGYHGREDVDVDLLGCDAVWTCRQIPAFWGNILPQGINTPTMKSYRNVGICREVHTELQPRRSTSIYYHITFQGLLSSNGRVAPTSKVCTMFTLVVSLFYLTMMSREN